MMPHYSQQYYHHHLMNQLHYNGSTGSVTSHQTGNPDEKKFVPSGQQDKMAAAALAAARAANAGYHYGTPPPAAYNHQIPPSWQLAV